MSQRTTAEYNMNKISGSDNLNDDTCVALETMRIFYSFALKVFLDHVEVSEAEGHSSGNMS